MLASNLAGPLVDAHAVDQTQFDQGGDGAVDGVERHGRNAVPDAEVDGLHVGVGVGGRDLARDLESLVGEAHAARAQPLGEELYAPFDLVMRHGHAARPSAA